jgi:hypothetical protein
MKSVKTAALGRSLMCGMMFCFDGRLAWAFSFLFLFLFVVHFWAKSLSVVGF